MSTMTVKEAADWLGVSEQCVRVGIRTGTLPIGWAVKGKQRAKYIITREKFETVTKINTQAR